MTNVETTDNEEKIFIKDWNYQLVYKQSDSFPYDYTETKSINGCIRQCKNIKHDKDNYAEHQKIWNEYGIAEISNRKYQWETVGVKDKWDNF